MIFNKHWHYGENALVGLSIAMIDTIVYSVFYPFVAILYAIWWFSIIMFRVTVILSPYVAISLFFYIIYTEISR